jgi:CheY-like chemotaxis protein
MPALLVVDDEDTIRGLLETGLRAHGFRVWAAATGAEGVALYRRQAADIALALLDVHMPGLDGPATARALRALDPTLPVLFMSGNIGAYTEEELLRLGAALIHKPFVLENVAQVLRRCLPDLERRRWARRSGEPFKVVVREEVEGWVKDRSQGGLGMWSDRPVAVDAVLYVRPAGAPETAPWVRVQVTHCRPQKDGWAVGCRFVDPSLARAVFASS